MASVPDCEQKAFQGVSFFCTKIHKWRGTYQRIVSISPEGIDTFNSEKNCITNHWNWNDVIDVAIDGTSKDKFTIAIRDGKLRNKYHFYCCLAPEIVCECRSHLLNAGSSTLFYTFSGSKVKGDKETSVEFEIHSGYLQMRLMEEDRVKVIPIYYITDAKIINATELVAISFRGDVHFYRLKERFGFLTALEKELRICGIFIDTTKQCDLASLLPTETTLPSPPCFSYRVKRLHCPIPSLLSHGYSSPWVPDVVERVGDVVERVGDVVERVDDVAKDVGDGEKDDDVESVNEVENVDVEENNDAVKNNAVENDNDVKRINDVNERTKGSEDAPETEPTRFLFLTNTAILEVLQRDRLVVHRAIPFEDILVITAEAADPSALVLQFQSKGFLRTSAFSCDSRADFLSALYCFYSSAPFHWTLVRSAFRFRGTSNDVKDIQRQCQREIATEGAGLEGAERFVANSRYFLPFADWSSEQYRAVVTQLTQAIKLRLDDPARENEVLLLLLCVQELTEHVQESLPASCLVTLLEPLFSSLTHSTPTLGNAFVALLAALTVRSVSPHAALASSFLSSTSILEFVVVTAFTSASSFTRYNALSVLIQAVLQAVSLPPPIPLMEAVHPLLRPYLLQLLSLLEEQSPAIQTQLFFLLHSLFLHTPSDDLLGLQRRAVDTCRFLQILRCALFDSSLSLQHIARALLALLSQHEPLFLSLLQRAFPQEFIRVLQTPHGPTLFRSLACDGEEETPTSSSFFVWKEIRQLAFPTDCFHFPAFFALCFQDSCSYKLVWGEAQRQELQRCLDQEIATWQSIRIPARWNDSQFVVLYSAYQRHQVLFGYFFPQLATIPVSFYCSSLVQVLSLPSVPTPRPGLELPNPALFFISLYARLLTCDTDASRVTLLKCMRVVYYDAPDLCGEFCDCQNVLEQIDLLRRGDVCRQYVLLLQVLLLHERNTVFLLQHAATVLPVLLQQLASLHREFDEQHAAVLLDILFHLLTQSTSSSSTPLLPLSPVITTLSSSSTIHTLSSLLFLPSPTITAFVSRILLHLLTVSQQSDLPSSEGSLCSVLLQTPFIDALLLHSTTWLPVHVQLLKVALHPHDMLHGVLPAAVVFALEVVSESKFCSLFGQETRSSRLIWTESMRAHLQRVIHSHIDAYLAALRAESAPVWQYTPLPPIHYAELDNEIYCGKYYLRYLSEHSVAAVKSPASLITSMKNEWIREGKRKGLSMSREEALALLHLNESGDVSGSGGMGGSGSGDVNGSESGDVDGSGSGSESVDEKRRESTEERESTEATLNCAYWREWAASDADKRRQLLTALNILTGCSITATAPIRSRLFLLVKVQCLLYATCYTRLTTFLYPSFEMLIAQTQNVVESEEVDECFLTHLVWLMYLACSCSVENMEAFGSKCGLTVIHHVIEWNDKGVKANRQENILILYYQCALLCILSQSLSLHSILCRCVEVIEYLVYYLVLPLPPVIHASIVDFFTNLAVDSHFRSVLLNTRVCVFTTLLPLLFNYDPTEEKLIEKDLNEQCLRLSATLHNASSRNSSISDLSDFNPSPAPACRPDATRVSEDAVLVAPESELAKATSDRNTVARKAVRLLSLLVTNEASFVSLLSPLLTKPLVSLLLESNEDDLLTILNSDFYETPFIVWTKEMREQLLQFLRDELLPSSHFVEDASQFLFTTIKDELMIADVYVRIFNEQQPKQFVKDTKYFLGLLAFLRSQRVGLKESGVWVSRYACSVNDTYVEMMLWSLHILLLNNPQLAENLHDQDDLLVLFGFLQPLRQNGAVCWQLDDPCIEEACAVLALLARKPRLCTMCVDSQAVDILFLVVLQDLPGLHAQLISLLYSICMNAVGKSLTLFNTGLWLYSLHLLFPPEPSSLSAPAVLADAPSDAVRVTASSNETHMTASSNDAHMTTPNDAHNMTPPSQSTPSPRSLALSLLSSWCNDESIKALCRVTLRRFLPEYLVEMICEKDDVLEVLDSTTITPECIWDASMRTQACHAISEQYARFIGLYTSNQPYLLPNDFEVVYDQIAGEWCIASVFISLYLDTPNYHVHHPTLFLDAVVKELGDLVTLALHPTRQSIPDSAEEEKKQRRRLLQVGETVCHVLQCEDTSVAEHFLRAGSLDTVVGLWKDCDATHQLDSVASECCCLVVSRVAESAECLKRIVGSKSVLELLLHCLMQGVHHSLQVAKCLSFLFKMKTPEMCAYLEELNVIPCLLSCFDSAIVVNGSSEEEGRRESAEILVTIQRVLLLIQKMPFLKKETADLLKDNPILTKDYSSPPVA